MKCNNCMAIIPDDSEFCMKCGCKITVSDSLFCRKCGKELPSDSLFCSKCGTSTELSSPPQEAKRPRYSLKVSAVELDYRPMSSDEATSAIDMIILNKTSRIVAKEGAAVFKDAVVGSSVDRFEAAFNTSFTEEIYSYGSIQVSSIFIFLCSTLIRMELHINSDHDVIRAVLEVMERTQSASDDRAQAAAAPGSSAKDENFYFSDEEKARRRERIKQHQKTAPKLKSRHIKIIIILSIILILIIIVEIRNALLKKTREEIWKDDNGHWVWEDMMWDTYEKDNMTDTAPEYVQLFQNESTRSDKKCIVRNAASRYQTTVISAVFAELP